MNLLSQLVCYQLDELFEKLDVDLRPSGKIYIGCCPIHEGDNYSALNLYPDHDIIPGMWRCNTHHCEHIFCKTIIGFIRGVLSRKYYGWTENEPKKNMAPFMKVINWICKLLKRSLDDIKINEQTEERHQFAAQIMAFKQATQTNTSGLSRNMVRKRLQIPANYYLNRGYKAETLDRFDVGLCVSPNKEMRDRVVVPIYEETGKSAIAFSGRSIYEKCQQCNRHHNADINCPTDKERKLCTKWRHSGNTGQSLYNWWNAKKSVMEAGHIILVEGPGDVWRLHEAGIDNAVAMMGADLTDSQQIILEKSGAMKVTIIRDNDTAGEMCEHKLTEELKYYKTNFIVPSKKDVGDMTVSDIQGEIIPQL